MKRKSHILVAATLGTIIFFGELGCIGEPFELSEAEASGISSDVANSETLPSLNYRPAIPVTQKLVVIPIQKSPSPSTNEPNAIILETCEPDPDEVAVPLNVEDDKECHKVHAFAAFASAHEFIYKDAKFTWTLASDDAVKIVSLPNTKHDESIKLEAKYDIFSYPDLTNEPSTTLQVCAEPIEGWKSPAHKPLCRSLTVRTVANMQGAWCFKGNEFSPDPGTDCEAIRINQDGRFLTIEDDDMGTIYEKQLDFYYNDFEFRTNESTYTEIKGLILAGNDVEGSFEAFRLPL